MILEHIITQQINIWKMLKRRRLLLMLLLMLLKSRRLLKRKVELHQRQRIKRVLQIKVLQRKVKSKRRRKLIILNQRKLHQRSTNKKIQRRKIQKHMMIRVNKLLRRNLPKSHPRSMRNRLKLRLQRSTRNEQ